MANCCGAPRCRCAVIAGLGVTVDGNGSAATPYTISSATNPTPVQAAHTPTVDTTVAGRGTPDDPYVVSSDVILDPAPPGGGSNLLQEGTDGLFVQCDGVRGCLTAGDGIAYDPATGEIEARPSTDAGNGVSFGTDGGLFAPMAEATVIEATDSTTVDVTVTGIGTAANPYEVSAAVILDPAPPGGGTNLLQAGPDGLLLECDDVRGCLSAGDGAGYTPATGTVEARLSTDATNIINFGTDGGLFVPPPVVDCGLTGAGTAADPIAVNPVAGQQAWSDDWACDAPTHSTLKCDPDTGALWTPPEHYSAAESVYVEHFNGGWATPLTPAGGWVVISNGANFQFNYPANFLGNDCRNWTFDACVAGTWDINYTSTAIFELGYVYSWNGGAAAVRPLWGLLTAPGTARRERDNGTWHEFGYNMPPDQPFTLVGWPAVRVAAGSLTINSWITDAAYHTTTQT